MLHYWREVGASAFTASLDSIGLNLGGFVFGLLVLCGVGVLIRRSHGVDEAKKHLAQNVFYVLLVTMLAFTPIFLWHLVRTPSSIDSALKGKLQLAQQEVEGLSNKIAKKDGNIAALTTTVKILEEQLKQKPPEVVKTVVQEEPRRCWFYDHPTFPNKAVVGGDFATEAILACNKRTDAPFDVVALFDTVFVEGTESILGAGTEMSNGGRDRNSRVFTTRVTSPSLLANQPVIVLVHAGKRIHAVGGSIVAVK